jgi:hypothetical protein
MKVNDLNGVLKGIGPLDNRRTEHANGNNPAKETRSDYGDSLDLSLSARASVSSGPGAASEVEPGLAPDRLADIRARIAEGYYNSPAVEAQIADRVLGFYAR